MAAAPPPYSPRDARRQARDMVRMQRAQYKAQFAYTRRPSFVGPLLVIATGVVALLLETGRLPADTFWPWYARWWPAALIFVGLGLLAEHFLDRNNPQAGRRSIGGVVWLIILLSIAGGTSHAVLNGRSWNEEFWHDLGDRNDWFSMMGEQHVEDRTLRQPMGAAGTLTIENARGDVDVTPGSPGTTEIRVDAHQVVHANSDEAARRDLDATRPGLAVHGADATLSAAGRDGASVDLKVTVPAGIALVVHTTHGDVALSGVRREVDVRNAHGDVTVDSAGTVVHIRMDHGDVKAHDIHGDLTIDGRVDDVSIAGVQGRTLLNGEFFGDTKLEQIGSSVHFHSSRTDLDVPRLGGEMTLDSGGLHLVNPSGGIHVQTRSKDIEVTGLVGDAHIENKNGDVNVAAVMPLGNLELINHTGSMVVTVPSNASFSVHGSSGSDDEVSSDFALSQESSSGRKTLTGQVGQAGPSSPHLELTTDHGDLTLHRGGSEIPEQAARHDRQERPASPERHLHSKSETPPQTTVQ